MPRGFYEIEKEHIKLDLLIHGKKIFSTFGLKKTSINDLTKAAGITQGTFYQFYQLNEDLYFDILELEEETIKAQFRKLLKKRIESHIQKDYETFIPVIRDWQEKDIH